MTRLKPYPAMKDSGVPWLGEVPEHWDMRRGKWLFRHRKQINSDRSNSNVLSLTLRGVVNNDPDNPEGLVPKDYASYQLFHKGDLVFKLIDLENLRTSRVGLVHEDGIMSSAYVRLSPQKVVDIRFFFQQYFDLYQRGIYNQLGAGVRSTLGPTDLLELSVVVPLLYEQAAIVRYLNYMDRRIRRYIRIKQRLIKLLEEQKQAIIHRAVTRGLDPNVRLKPSGVEWLGDVPEHWVILPIKRAFISMDYGISESANDSGTIRLLTMGNIKDGQVTIPGSGGVASVVDTLLLENGDLLFNRTNSSELVGKVGLYRDSDLAVTFASYLVRMRPRSKHMPEYLNMLLNDISTLSIARRESIPSLHQSNLNPTRYGRLQIALPPLEEQREILQLILKRSYELDRAIATGHREIALLREYRTRLIADVVTGKLDVREVAALLPDEADEQEPIDEIATIDNSDEEPTDDLDTVQEV